MTTRITAVLCFILAALSAASASAQQWAQWRGPALNGSTPATSIPEKFSPTENVAWVTPMPGQSGATPAVWGDRVFVSSVEGDTGHLLALCLDAATGKILWRKDAGQNRKASGGNNMASPSPITDGKAVYFFYGTSVLLAMDLGGNPLWSRDLEKDNGRNALMYGYSSSPLLYKGKLYVAAIRSADPSKYGGSGARGTVDSYLLAIDPATGKDIWKQVRQTDATGESQEAYTTPIPYEFGGRSEILLYGADTLTGHDADTGKELWRWTGYNPTHITHWRVVPSPVVAGDLVVVVGPKYSTMFAIRADAKGTLDASHVAWKLDKTTPDASTPLLYQDRLYVIEDNKKIMTCLDPKTGKQKWQFDLGGKNVIRGSALGADGRIYIMNEGGEVIVAQAGDEPKILHRIQMGTREYCWSSLVAANGRLFIRTSDKLFCVALPATAR